MKWLLTAATALACVSAQAAGPSETLLKRMSPSSGFAYNVSACTGYDVKRVNETDSGILAELSLISECRAFGNDIPNLILNVSYDTTERLHVHIFDAAELQWQVPSWLLPRPSSATNSTLKTTSDLSFNYTSSPFEWWITRRSTSDILFDTRNASMPTYADVIPASDLGESGIVDDASYHNRTSLGPYPFVFEDQYLQVTSKLPLDANIYGLGYAVSSSGFRRNNTATVQAGWAADRGDNADSNIYGNFPFYLEHRIKNNTGASHGVFLLSSNGMDVILRPGVIQYRIVGGTLDFTFFSGPSPTAVVQQYGAVSGFSQLPPTFALGFNLCRWGYKNVMETKDVVRRMREAMIPLETMWNDIDWMHAYRNFVPSPNEFAPAEYGAFVDELHSNHQHYVMIIDAAINLELNKTDVYDTYRSGHDLDVFVKNPDGTEYIGQVWPGATAFPDYFAGNTQAWWTQAFHNLSQIIKYDGVWLDMNEVSSFVGYSSAAGDDLSNTSTPFHLPGTPYNLVTGFPEGYNGSISGFSGNISVNGTLTYKQSPPRNSSAVLGRRDMLKRSIGSGGKINYPGQSSINVSLLSSPPYLIHNAQDYTNLASHLLAPNATHANGVVELDVHNIYGFMEEKATHAALLDVYPAKRPYLISRSLFTGAGIYTGAWGGDNSASWIEMERSIQVILSYQMYHVALIGVDACGFNGNTDEELCNRWMQLAAFSPFFRNHNVLGAISQEPYVWDSVAEASRIAIKARYELLPTWETLFAASHFHGTPVVNALFFVYPNDASLLAVSSQYLVGDSILVTPVLTPNVTTVTGLFPEGRTTIWRDWFTHKVINTSTTAANSSAANVTLSAPLGSIPISIRGGSIHLLSATAGYTIYETKQSGLSLLVALDRNGTASGTGYQDDGSSYPVQTDGDWFTYTAHSSTLTSSAGSGSQSHAGKLSKITILGVEFKPLSVKFNDVAVGNFTYDSEVQRLTVQQMSEDVNGGFTLTW